MPALKPIKRRELISRLRELGFEGPYSGGKHQYVVKEHCIWLYQIPITRLSVWLCLLTFCGKRE